MVQTNSEPEIDHAFFGAPEAEGDAFSSVDEEQLLTALAARGVISLKEADDAFAARPNAAPKL